MPSQIPREVRVNLRLSKSIADRVELVAQAAGQSQSVVAALALAAGLKSLESMLLPRTAEMAALMAVKLAQRMDPAEVDEQIIAAAQAEAAAKVGT